MNERLSLFDQTGTALLGQMEQGLGSLSWPLPFPCQGHLLSTAEVESALVEHKAVAEAAVVGHPHPVKGECLYCFVTLCDGHIFSPALTEDEMPTGSNCETLGPLKAIVSTSDPSLAFPRGGLWDPGTTMLPFLGGRSPQDHLEKRGGSQGLLDGHQGRGAIPE